jgi:hypothetical protein
MNPACYRGHCSLCGEPSAAIAVVRLRVPGTATRYRQDPSYLCPGCRKARRGNYRLFADATDDRPLPSEGVCEGTPGPE